MFRDSIGDEVSMNVIIHKAGSKSLMKTPEILQKGRQHQCWVALFGRMHDVNLVWGSSWLPGKEATDTYLAC